MLRCTWLQSDVLETLERPSRRPSRKSFILSKDGNSLKSFALSKDGNSLIKFYILHWAERSMTNSTKQLSHVGRVHRPVGARVGLRGFAPLSLTAWGVVPGDSKTVHKKPSEREQQWFAPSDVLIRLARNRKKLRKLLKVSQDFPRSTGTPGAYSKNPGRLADVVTRAEVSQYPDSRCPTLPFRKHCVPKSRGTYHVALLTS